MARTMTEEHKAKIRKANEAARKERAERRQSILTIGPYQCFQADEDNWVIREGEDGDPRYYPTKVSALQAVLHMRIGDAQTRSVLDVLAAVKKAEAEIVSVASC